MPRMQSAKQILKALEEARDFRPATGAGLWAQKEVVEKLEGDLIVTHCKERAQAGEVEERHLYQLAGLPYPQ